MATRDEISLELRQQAARANPMTGSKPVDRIEIERLRADVERLTDERDAMEDALHALRAEQISAVNAMLKAKQEIARLTVSRDEWRENYQKCDQARDALWGENQRLTKERAPLRAAVRYEQKAP